MLIGPRWIGLDKSDARQNRSRTPIRPHDRARPDPIFISVICED
jgi:hypothetical protein